MPDQLPGGIWWYVGGMVLLVLAIWATFHGSNKGD